MIAILLRVFLSRWQWWKSVPREESRPLEAWLSLVATSREEAKSLIPPIKTACIDEVLASMDSELSFAVEEWLLGNPERPPTAHALNAVLYILFTHKIIPRPPVPEFPTTLRNA